MWPDDTRRQRYSLRRCPARVPDPRSGGAADRHQRGPQFFIAAQLPNQIGDLGRSPKPFCLVGWIGRGYTEPSA